MPDHAAFLRGMNIGGRRITNAELRVHFEAMCLRDVGVFRASGNVVFTAPEEAPAGELAARIEGELAAALGYAVPVFLRSALELRAIASHQPFPRSELAASAGKLQVALLLRAPASAARRKALALASPADRLAFGERELYWLPSGGLLKSTLDLEALAALLGQTTIRTMGTVGQLARRYFTD